MAEQSIAERLREGIIYHKKRWSGDTHTDMGSSVDEDATDAVMAQAADEIDRLTKERDEAREALTDIAVYGCGMLNQPAAMNAPEEVWLQKRIREYERVARAALNKDTANG